MFSFALGREGMETKGQVTPGAKAPGVIIFRILQTGARFVDNKTCYQLRYNN